MSDDGYLNEDYSNDGTYTNHPEYDRLPRCIRYLYNPKEFAYLPEIEKRNIIDDNTLPELFDD